MPIVKIEQFNKDQVFAIWKITESQDMLLKSLIMAEEEKEELHQIHNEKKILECLGGKSTVQFLTKLQGKVYEGLYKDIHSKRFLVNNPWHISISHSFPYATAILSKKSAVGIDIEKPNEKVLKIRNKFLNQDELQTVGNDLEKASLFWSAKEALYKLYGKKKLIFKENIKVCPSSDSILSLPYLYQRENFKPGPQSHEEDKAFLYNGKSIYGEISVNREINRYELISRKFEGFFIVSTGKDL